MDEVLNNLLNGWVAYLNNQYHFNANVQDINRWDLRCIYPSLTDEEVNRPLSENTFWQGLATKPSSVETLKEMMDDGHEVLIVTASSVYKTLPAKMDWFFDNYPYLSWENIVITCRKQIVQGDVLIDDAVHNLEGGDYFKILMDCPNNHGYDTEKNGMVRVYTLKQAYDVIKEALL